MEIGFIPCKIRFRSASGDLYNAEVQGVWNKKINVGQYTCVWLGRRGEKLPRFCESKVEIACKEMLWLC